MMLTSASLHRGLNVRSLRTLPVGSRMVAPSRALRLWQALGYEISLNDVCVFIPAWFSCLTCAHPLSSTSQCVVMCGAFVS